MKNYACDHWGVSPAEHLHGVHAFRGRKPRISRSTMQQQKQQHKSRNIHGASIHKWAKLRKKKTAQNRETTKDLPRPELKKLFQRQTSPYLAFRLIRMLQATAGICWEIRSIGHTVQMVTGVRIQGVCRKHLTIGHVLMPHRGVTSAHDTFPKGLQPSRVNSLRTRISLRECVLLRPICTCFSCCSRTEEKLHKGTNPKRSIRKVAWPKCSTVWKNTTQSLQGMLCSEQAGQKQSCTCWQCQQQIKMAEQITANNKDSWSSWHCQNNLISGANINAVCVMGGWEEGGGAAYQDTSIEAQSRWLTVSQHQVSPILGVISQVPVDWVEVHQAIRWVVLIDWWNGTEEEAGRACRFAIIRMNVEVIFVEMSKEVAWPVSTHAK